ncbi:MAG: helicase-associated domain-containing protein [Candidatus Cloacimonetes bacterium]|nr:helicase-associated domain-containing protein [Candidatus Cloacimonadota bacterium]
MPSELISAQISRALKYLACYMDSDLEHVEVLFFLCAEGGETPRDEVLRELERTHQSEPARILDELRSAGLVRNRRTQNATGETIPVLALAPDLEALLRLPTFYRNRLRSRLNLERESVLAGMDSTFYRTAPANSWTGDRRVLQLARFKALLLDPELFKAAAEEHFDPAQRVLLKVLAMNPRGLTLKDLRRHMGFFGQGMGYDDIKAHLSQIYRVSGLLFSTGGENLLKQDQYFAVESRVVLVQDAQEMLKTNFGLTNPPRQIYPEYPGRIEPEAWKVIHGPDMLFHNVLALLVHVISNRVSRIQKGGIHKSEARRINARFNPPQEDSALLNVLVDYLENRGVLKLNNKVWAVDVSAATAFFANPGASLTGLFEYYFDVDPLQPATWITRFSGAGSGRSLDAVRVLWVLNHISPDAWTSTDDVAWLYLQSEGGGSDARLADVDRFVSQLVLQPLLWMGLVEVARMPEDGGTVFRLSARGRLLIREGKAPDTMGSLFREDENLIVQSNLEIFTPVGCPPAAVLYLARFADPEKGRFRLSTQSLSRGFDSGVAVEQMLSFLETRCPSGIPQNVSYMLSDAATKHGHILLDPQLRVLKTEDAILQKELSLVPSLRKFWLAPFSPCILMIASNVAAERVVEDLRRLGYMPRVRWESVVGEDETQLDLNGGEINSLLSLIRAFELSDTVNPRLAEWLLQVDEELSPERRELKTAIAQKDLGPSYQKLEELSRALRAR